MRIKIPSEVKILGYIYQVKVTQNFQKEVQPYMGPKDKAEDYQGWFSTGVNTIWIDGMAEEQTQESVFIHEIVEVINALLALGIKHDNIDRLEAAFYQILKENDLFGIQKAYDDIYKEYVK